MGASWRRRFKELHHLETAQAVEREREHFRRYGGGCHLAVGIQVERVAGRFVHFQRGEVEDGQEVARRLLWRLHETFVEGPDLTPELLGPFFVGLPQERNPRPDFFLSDQLTVKVKVPLEVERRNTRQCSFVTSRYCFDGFEKNSPEG